MVLGGRLNGVIHIHVDLVCAQVCGWVGEVRVCVQHTRAGPLFGNCPPPPMVPDPKHTFLLVAIQLQSCGKQNISQF